MPTILVVDDEFGVAEVIEAILVDEGYEVVCAINGRQALERIEASMPDLVLLDTMMPIMDGPATLAALRAKPESASLPVIVMSSLDETTVRERTHGFEAFVRKPFRSGTIINVVGQVLASLGQRVQS